MDIVSIKSFMRPSRPKPADYLRCIHLLLQGLGLHGVEGDVEDLSRFRRDLSTISEQLTEDSSGEDILLATGVILRTLEEYSRNTAKFNRAHLTELQTMLGMMTETISFLGVSSKVGVEQLQNIEKKLEKAASIEDVRTLRGKLTECLTTVRNEGMRVSAVSQERIRSLQAGVERATSHIRAVMPAQAVDTATGLPGREAAEQSIISKILEGSPCLAAVFIVDRMNSINARFGKVVSDEVLMFIAQHLGEKLPAHASLYRWGGPAFLAMLENVTSVSSAEQQMKGVVAARMQKSIEISGRSVLLPIACSFMVQKITPADAADVVFRTIDKFVDATSGAPVKA